MSAHYKGSNKEIRKSGLTINVKKIYSDDPAKAAELNAKATESAIRALKRLADTEGVIKDIRRKEYHETRGQIRRRKKGEAIRREHKNRKLADW